jgi:hypothetical protein
MKNKKPKKQRKIIPLDTKTLGNDITEYPFVEIRVAWILRETQVGVRY